MVSKNTCKIQVAESQFSDRHMVSAGHHLAADAAIRFARQGFAVTELSAEIYAAEADELRSWPENERIYLPKGRPPRAGETLVLRDLADSLQYMADQETSAAKKGRAAGLQAVRAAFYQGDIARKILRYHSQNNGWLTEDDLKDFRVEIEGYDPGKKFSPPAADDGYPPVERDTSFVCAVDRWGNCFAATPSDVNSTAPVIPGTGLIPSPRGSQSFDDPSHPACLAPGKRPRLTPNPAIIINPGRWAMPFGTPGSDVQVQAMVEVLLNIQLNKMSVQEAINAPRFATMSFPQTSTPHEYDRDLLLLEDRIPAAVGDHLANVGHMVKKWRDYDWRAGAVCAIKRDEKTGRLEGGADPRRPTGVA